MSSYFSPKRDILGRLNSQGSKVQYGVNHPSTRYYSSKTPPPKLPHLSTPPTSPGVLDLRRNYYGVVPPLNQSTQTTWKRKYLSRRDAAVVIQRYYRGWSVRKGPRFCPWRYMCHRRFGEDFVQRLIEEFLIESIFPELLWETFASKKTVSHPFPKPVSVAMNMTERLPVEMICEDLIKEGVQHMVRQIVNELYHVKISFKSQMTFNYRVISQLSDNIVEEFIREERVRIVHETIHDLVSDHIIMRKASSLLEPLIDESIEPLLYDVAVECFKDAQFVIPYEEILDYEIQSVASESYEEIRAMKLQEEYKQVMKYAQDRLADGLCLEQLLTHITGNNHNIYYDDYMNKLLDGYIVDVLLGVYFSVNQSVESTVTIWPINKLHQDITSEIALTVILEEIAQHLDEDMLDSHEHEKIHKN